MATPLEFRARTRLVVGLGCVEARLGDELRGLGVDTVAVIADRGFADAGLLEPLLAAAAARAGSGADAGSAATGVELPVVALIGVDPDVDESEAAAQAAIDAGAQAVLAIGGGSALCAAKAVAIRLTNEGPLDRYVGRDRLPNLPAPSIAIPTTAGSGSEVSTVVVLHDTRLTQHLVIRGRGYEPDVALLDGTLLRTLPAAPLVHAALDALSHALEALWSRKATWFTDTAALAAAERIRTALPAALARDDDALQALIEASAMANLACGNAEMGIVHALSAAPDVHLPHGYQNGVLLPHAVAYNLPVLGAAAAAEASRIDDLYRELEFEARFGDGELSADDADLMVAAALANPFLANNRRPAGEDELRTLLAAAGAPT